MQILAGLQSQLQSAQQTMDAARQQKLYLESLLQQYQSVQASMGGGDSAAAPPQTLETELAVMRLKLQDLQSRYTAEHPDIIALKEKIAEAEQLKKQADSEMAAVQKDGNTAKAVDLSAVMGAQRGSPTPIMQVQSQLKANQLEITNIQQHEKDLESQITGYQARLNLTPETEQDESTTAQVRGRWRRAFDQCLPHAFTFERAAHVQRRRLDDVADVDVLGIDANLVGQNDSAFSAKIVNSRRQIPP